MCNHWPLNVNSKKYRPVLERRGQMNSAAICLNTVKDLLPIPLAKRMKKRVPQGSMIPQYRTLKIPLEKKCNTAKLRTHMSPPHPSKIIMSKILTYTSSVTIWKKNDQNRISVLPECLLKAETNLFYRSCRRKEFQNLARFWKWSTDSYPLTLKLIRRGREVLRKFLL